MSILFEPLKIGEMEVRNRFVRSATVENMARESGEITTELIKFYTRLAKGEIGLIIPGYMYIHPSGQSVRFQTGIYNDDLIHGLKKITDTIHKQDGKVAFQIAHAGIQTYKGLIGKLPSGPSGKILNPSTLTKSKEMLEEEIFDSIQAFADAAERAVAANADAVQLHAAHGYLINQFLSPFYNRRSDDWGGSEENRFRFLKEIILKVKSILPRDIPLLIKLNSNDYTFKDGITPPVAAKYAQWLTNLGIDAIEVSCGSAHFAIFQMCRGEVPVKEITQYFPDKLKPLAEKVMQDMVGKYDFEEGYNLEAGKSIKSKIGEIPLMLVGGLRSFNYMEDIVKRNYTDFISISRPFIREPFLVKNFKEGKTNKAACISCNRCFAAIPNDYPISCYVNKFPNEIKPTVYI